MKKIFLALFIIIIAFCFKTYSANAAGASLYLSPNSGTFYVGSIFNVSIFLDTGNNNVNAVYANLKFDPQKIQIASPTAGKSFISVWISQPTYSNKDGSASFLGGNPSPGVNTSAGLVSTITFRIVAPGETTITFSTSSQVLLDDGKGTDILNSRGRGTYTLSVPPPEGPVVFSPTHPDQNKWYKNNNPTFSWDKEAGVTDFSYDLNQDSQGVPDNISEGSTSSVSYSDIAGGIWYFHVKAEKNGIWGGTSHYLVQIDNVPPATFAPVISPSAKTSDKQPIVSFVTTDSLSGFDHFEIKVINVTPTQVNSEEAGFFIEAASPYKLSQLTIGKYMVFIRAFDKAGNWRDISTKLEIIPGGISFSEDGIFFFGFLIKLWLVVLITIAIIIFIAVLLYLIFKKQQNMQLKIKERLEQKENELRSEAEKIKNVTDKIE